MHSRTKKIKQTGEAANNRRGPSESAQSVQSAARGKRESRKLPSTRSPVVSTTVMASGEPASLASLGVQDSMPVARSRFRARGITRGKPRLLWIGDVLVPTGFAMVTHAVLDHLRHEWEVIVSGVNYEGAPHDLPYHVMPARQDGDMWGINRFQHLCAEFDPAAVIINNDWWNVAQFARIAPAGVPIIGYMPVDGGNLDPGMMKDLNKLQSAVWYTDFGHRAAKDAGFTGRRLIIPHGIDTKLFQPADRQAARRLLILKVPPDAFIVGNVNRNQPRKRLDITIQIFAAWIKQYNIANAHLLLHCAQNDTGWDLRRVAAFYGVADRLILTGAQNIREMQEVSALSCIYNCLDVQMTTTLGEGWGLTTMEGMACGIPQIVPDSSALGEWATPAIKIPCSRTLFHPEINTTGALVDEAPFVSALQMLYEDVAKRGRLSAQGLEHVCAEGFCWENVAGQFQTLLADLPKTAKKRLGNQRLLRSKA